MLSWQNSPVLYSLSHLAILALIQVNINLAGLPALVLPCGFVEGGPAGLPVGLQMIGAAFDEVLISHSLQIVYAVRDACVGSL